MGLDRMNAAFIKLGLSGCDVGVSYLLPRLVGASVASELILTWRETFARRQEEPEAASKSKSGFTGTVLGRIVPQALAAQVEHVIEPDHLIYQLTIPASQYELHAPG